MDMKLLKRAKENIDALAEGIDPWNNVPIPSGEVVSQEKMVLCLKYVSSVLGEVLKNGGVQVEPSERDPFSPQKIDCSEYQYSEVPITISDVIKRINACRPITMRKVGTMPFLKWMEEEGFLEKQTQEEIKSKTHYLPGRRAAEIGITEEYRNSNSREYIAVLYSKTAQRFLLANLNSIVGKAEKPKAKENEGQPWILEDDIKLLSMWKCGIEISQMEKVLGRSSRTIRKRLEKLFVDKAEKPSLTHPLTDEAKDRMERFGRLISGKESLKGTQIK
ncbi:MAG: hypothetical protein IKN72_11835 [Clostridia bacterium]|nr:hypothetical protein [Clostridia bacterium]